MLAYLRKVKWSIKTPESRNNQPSLLLAAFIGILEDVLFWRRMWQSLTFLFFFHIIFFVCLHKAINLLQFLCCFCIVIVGIDAFEMWLKYKHRTTCLKRLVSHDATRLKGAVIQVNNWIRKKCNEFMYLRETNHTKAFLLVNIVLGMVFFIGKYISGYLLIYLLCMSMCFFYKLVPPIRRVIKKIQQNAESDGEFEGLIPDVSDVDINLLSIEPEHNQVIDEKQSLDYWKPEDVPIEEISDSSDNSSSLVTNISMEKMQKFDKDIETSDSSEDEYIPLVQQKEQLQSTVEIIEPTSTWSGATFSAFRNFTGAVANMMYTASHNKKNRLSSVDSSDGFEIIDKNDLN